MNDPDGQSPPQTTCLYDQHTALEARFGTEGGWTVPLAYRSVLEEVAEAHQRAVVTDLSHLGRIQLSGSDAVELLERVCCHDVVHQEDDTVQPTALLTSGGGVLEVPCLARLDGKWLMTTHPGNRPKVLAHLHAQAAELSVKIKDTTESTAQIAVIGPGGGEILDAVLPEPVSALPRRAVRTGSYMVARYTAMRTGATRLWSLEVILPKLLAGRAWSFITAKAGERVLAPMGLAARDVLRVEAGLVRYGHEVHEAVHPRSAGLDKWFRPDATFIGAAAASQQAPAGGRRLMGLRLGGGSEGGVPTQGAPVLDADGAEVGNVTSGTLSPTMGRLALAHLTDRACAVGAAVRVELAGGTADAMVATLPFA